MVSAAALLVLAAIGLALVLLLTRESPTILQMEIGLTNVTLRSDQLLNPTIPLGT